MSQTESRPAPVALDQRMVKAIGHPIRMRLLTILNQRVASPKELAAEIGSPIGTVSYHIRLLLDLGAIDRPIAFLGERRYAFWTVTGVAVWHDLGINMVFFLAALQTVSRDLYEAADLDGASAWSKFREITLPAIRPMTAVIVMLSLAGSLKVFDHFAVMTGGGPGFSTTTMVLYMFRYTSFGGGGLAGNQTIPNIGYGSTVAIGLGLIIFAAVLLQQWIARWQEGR